MGGKALLTVSRASRAGGAAHAGCDYIGRMNRRTALAAPFALFALALPAQAEKLSLATISKYLNSLTTAEADFRQINSDGSVSKGKLFIKRPNRVRFEYAPPDRNLVLASGGQVAVFDGKSNQPPEQYPLKRTPLNLILGQNIDLGKARMVVGHAEVAGTTRVIAQDPQNPEYGTIEMVFSAKPVALRQWIITDNAGGQTVVELGPLVTGLDYPPSTFNIEVELGRRKN